MKYFLEACIDNTKYAQSSEKNGASRIELCSSLDVGGLTPSRESVMDILEKVNIPVRIMIRPRSGNFIYTKEEFEKMKADILFFRNTKIEGFVFGLLNKYGEIDIQRTKELIELSKGKKITFHKAIDHSKDILKSTLVLIDLGVDNILSSGGAERAENGAEILNEMIKLTNDIVIVAGKVTYDNLHKIKKLIPSSNYHGRRIVENQKEI